MLPNKEARSQARNGKKQDIAKVDAAKEEWKTGELEFEAMMRALDNLVSIVLYINFIDMIMISLDFFSEHIKIFNFLQGVSSELADMISVLVSF